jgi:threonine synthase
VPTGNFGNVYASWIAKQMGAPIERIAIANNANHMLASLVTTGSRVTPDVVPTLAPAMDIAVPSNLERFTGDPMTEFRAGYADDDQILDTIAEVDGEHGYLLDPHTAAAWFVGSSTRTERRQVVVGTAHPAKFTDAVEKAVGRRPALPPGFDDLLTRPERMVQIDAEASELDALVR